MAKTRRPKLSDYQKKLQNPKWQKRRLEVLEAADWRCTWCGNSEMRLEAHHGYYRRKADPWDYGDEYLHCLCSRCHERAESERSELYRIIGMIPPSRIYDLVFTVADYAAKALPEKAAERAAAPSEPEPEPDPDDLEADPAYLESFFGSMKDFLNS